MFIHQMFRDDFANTLIRVRAFNQRNRSQALHRLFSYTPLLFFPICRGPSIAIEAKATQRTPDPVEVFDRVAMISVFKAGLIRASLDQIVRG